MTLLFLQGIPGSGKSTLASELETTGWVRVNKDDIRAELAKDGWTWSPKAEGHVIEIRNQKITTALSDGKNVVSDDCNFGRKHRNALATIAKVCGAEFETKKLDVPLETCLERNAKREGTARVPDHVIVKIWTEHVKENPYVFPKSARPSQVKVEPVVKSGNLMPAIICDLDGTIALCEGYRNVYDASRCDETDKLNVPVYKVLKAFQAMFTQIIYLTGRDESYREPTQRWLDNNHCPPGPLFMRPEGDSRNGAITKLDMFNTHVRDKYDVVLALDDMLKIVRMFKSIGIPCLQVHAESEKND